MDLEVTEVGSPSRYRVRGYLDMSTVPKLLEVLGARNGDGGDLRLDLAEVTFVDSQGIRGFVAVSTGLPDGARLVLAGARPEVARVFDIVGLAEAPRITLER